MNSILIQRDNNVPFSVCRGKTSCWGCSFLWLRLSKHLSKDESFHYRESLTILVNASKATESRKSFSHAKTYSRVTWLQRWARGAQGLCNEWPLGNWRKYAVQKLTWHEKLNIKKCNENMSSNTIFVELWRLCAYLWQKNGVGRNFSEAYFRKELYFSL